MINKYFVYILLILMAVAILFRSSLLPGNSMYIFHDESQGPRLQEFTYNLKKSVIPPRMAPHFSFAMGYPVFNFYAPFSYWVSSGFVLAGMDIADSLKSSFLLAVIVSGLSMILYLRRKFSLSGAVFGGLIYISSPWIASEIFVRGNLGEMWFIALLPLTLYFLERNAQERSSYIFVATAFVLSFLLTAHNVLSLVFLPIAVFYIWNLAGSKRRNFMVIFLAILLSSYFLIPAVVESRMTYASEVAMKTKYADHFLCLFQIWTANGWGFGGSAPGCLSDGMSFMLGKIQIITGALGMVLFLFIIIRRGLKLGLRRALPKPVSRIDLYVLVVTLIALFMTVYSSKPIWDAFRNFIAVFQFPWRFLVLILFGLAYFSGYLMNEVKPMALKFLLTFLLVYAIFSGAKYFKGNAISKNKYVTGYLSERYIRTTAARKISEYVPQSAQFDAWSLLDPGSPTFLSTFDNDKPKIRHDTEYYKRGEIKSKDFRINILYFPYWEIKVNGMVLDPQEFDFLGRPIVHSEFPINDIEVRYRQTNLELVSDMLSLLAFVVAGMIILRREKSIFYLLLK